MILIIKSFLLLFSFLISISVSAQLKEEFIADLPEELYETSGLAFYQQKYLITHNDGGNENKIYILNLSGEIKKIITLEGSKNKDWEDLALDTDENLYVGDFGNNSNTRKELTIYKLTKGFIDSSLVQPEKISFTYEDQAEFPPVKSNLNFDCEAMVIIGDSILIFTKCRTEPFSGITNIYYIPNRPGKHVAKKIYALQLCSSDWRFCSVTSADFYPRQNLLALLTYSRLYLIENFNINNLSGVRIKSHQLNFVKQREAITFINSKSLYMTDEYKRGIGGGNLYKLLLTKE